MPYPYAAALSCISSARNKRGRNGATDRLFTVVRGVHQQLPAYKLVSLDDDELARRHASIQDDITSTTILRQFGPMSEVRGCVPKRVNGDGNCLFNAASVALIGDV